MTSVKFSQTRTMKQQLQQTQNVMLMLVTMKY